MINSVIIDSNLLVLLVVGATRKNLIKKHLRTKMYSPVDFDLLLFLIGKPMKLTLLPNVITETSNLIADYREPDRSHIRKTLKAFIDMFREDYVTSKDAAGRSEYVRLGITDAALLQLHTSGSVLLTDDLDLHNAAQAAGMESTYFFYKRMENGLLS